MEKEVLKWFSKHNKSKNQKIEESAIDFEQKTLSSDIWTSSEKMKPEIKKFIVKRFDDILDYCKIDKDRVVTIFAFGSLCGFQYNKYSDLDVQIKVRYTGDKEEAEKQWEIDGEQMKKFIPVGYELYKDLKHPINYFINPLFDWDDTNNIYPYSLDPLYNIEEDKWIRKRQVKLVVKDRIAFEPSTSWARKIDSDYGELKRDIIDMLFLREGIKSFDNLKVGSEYIANLRRQKISEIVFDLDNLIYLFKLVKDFRTQSQVDVAEKYKDINTLTTIEIDNKNFHLFSGIIAWKRLVFFGYINLIGNLKVFYKEYIDKKITQEELIQKLNKEILPEGDKIWLH